jgi:hypothetical protein
MVRSPSARFPLSDSFGSCVSTRPAARTLAAFNIEAFARQMW